MYRKILRSDYETVLASARKLYPNAGAAVTAETLDAWYARLPEYGIVFTDSNAQIAGLFILIPLSRSGWDQVIAGASAADITRDSIFDPDTDSEMGLYCYHIEKRGDEEGFYMRALTALNEVLHLHRRLPHVLGLTAYAVSTPGIELFGRVLQMRERTLPIQEYIARKGDALEVVRIANVQEFNERLDQGYVIQNKCALFVATPDDVSPIWSYIR